MCTRIRCNSRVLLYTHVKKRGAHRHIVPGLFVGCWGTYLLQTTESSDHDVDPQDDPVLALQKLLGMKLVHLDGLVFIHFGNSGYLYSGFLKIQG